MTIRTLQTVEDVVKELGGTVATSRLAGAHPSQVSAWLASKKLGAKTYVALQQALAAKGFTAPASLWGMVEPAPSEQESAA